MDKKYLLEDVLWKLSYFSGSEESDDEKALDEGLELQNSPTTKMESDEDDIEEQGLSPIAPRNPEDVDMEKSDNEGGLSPIPGNKIDFT